MTDRNKYISQKTTENYNNGGDMIDVVHNSEYGDYNTYSFGDELNDGGFGFWGRVWNDLTGQTAQQKEFAQQEYLQDKQNEYNTPAAQMARMKAAGINANLAAGAIAQGGSESAQAPAVSNNTAGAAQGLQAAASGLSSAGDVANAVTGGLKNIVEAGNLSILTPWQRIKLQADTLLSLENAGLSKAQARLFNIDADYRPQQLALGIGKLKGEISNIYRMGKVLHSEYKLNLASAAKMYQDVLESKGRVDLMTWQELEMKANAAKLNAEAGYINKKFEYLRNFHWYVEGGFPALLAGLAFDRAGEESEDNVNMWFDNVLESWYEMHNTESAGAAEGAYDTWKKQLEDNLEFEKDLKSYGLSREMFWSLVKKYVFGVGFTVGAGKFSVTNSDVK